MKEEESEKNLGGVSHLWSFEKLKGSANWKKWDRSTTNALYTMGILHVITDDPPQKPTVFTKIVIDALGNQTTQPMTAGKKEKCLTDWADQARLFNLHNRTARGYINTKLTSSVLDLVDDIYAAKELYTKLKTQYQDTEFTRKGDVWTTFMNTKLIAFNDNLDDYIAAVNKTSKELKDLKYEVSDDMVITALFNGLNGKFKELTSRIIMSEKQPSFEAVCAMLQEQDRMDKCNIAALAFRAQYTKPNDNNNQKKPKGDAKDKEKHCENHPNSTNHTTKDCFLDERNAGKKEEYYKNRKKGGKKSKKDKEKEKDKAKGSGNDDADSTTAYVFATNTASDYTAYDFDCNEPETNQAFTFSTKVDADLENHDFADDVEEKDATAFNTGVHTDPGHSDDWFFDSGCSNHMTPSKRDFIDYSKIKTLYAVHMADNRIIHAKGRGTVSIANISPQGEETTLTIRNVLHVPGLVTGLLSTPQFTNNQGKVIYDEDYAFVVHKPSNKTVFWATKSRNQYQVSLVREQEIYIAYSAAVNYSDKAIELWHRRCGHLNTKDLMRLSKMVTGMDLTKKPLDKAKFAKFAQMAGLRTAKGTAK